MPRALLSRQMNLALSNRALAGANWGDINTTRTGGQPDANGGVQACLVSETAAAGQHFIYNAGSIITVPSPAQGRWYCVSAYLAPGTRGFGGFIADGSGVFTVYGIWNLTTGANVTLSSAGAVAKASATLLETLAGGWRRYQIAFYALSGPANLFCSIMLSDNGVNVGYAGDITKNVLVFAPGFTFANQAGELTDTTAATLPGPIRNLASVTH